MRELVRRELKSFLCAFRGVAIFVASERHAWMHVVATGLVVSLGWFFKVQRWEWCALVAVVGLVWTAEAVNTAVERLCDVVSEDHHPVIGQVKDIAAGAVVFASMAAATVGGIVFLPYMFGKG